MASRASRWDPELYERFADERQRPFFDLLDLVEPCDGMAAVDLGCGTGALTAQLHAYSRAARTLGVDRSETMLARVAAPIEGPREDPREDPDPAPGLVFQRAELTDVLRDASYDLVFSNAALHWIEDHPRLFERLRTALKPGGQLAVQVPANHDALAYRTADALAAEEPFRTALAGFVRRSPVLTPEGYAELLDELGFAQQAVFLRVYSHRLPGPSSVLDWIRGTYLTAYQERMSTEVWRSYLEELGSRLSACLPAREPFFFPFKRILLWARL